MKLNNFFKVVSTILVVMASLSPIVNAQSQEDITECEFDASSRENLYIQLNYSCENVPWLPKTYDIYRRINDDNIACDKLKGEFWTGEGKSLSDGDYFVEDYMLFFNRADGSSRDTVSWFENEYKNNKAELNLAARVLPRPFLVDDAYAESNEKLKALKGYVVCPVYKIEDGKYVTDSAPEKFVRADLVPPTVQQVENMVVDIIYLIWGSLFIIGLVMLTYLGFQFIFGGNSPEKLGELRTKLGLWLLGLFFVVLAIPLVNFIYSLVGIQTTKCYKFQKEGSVVYDLTVPGFTFFFNDVCTGNFAIEDNPTPPSP